MGSGNWIVDNLNSALQTWNDKLAEIWTLISTTPEEFKGGGIWNVIVSINGALQAIGYALLVLFFVMGVVKTCGSFTEIKRPEVAFKCFIRFVLLVLFTYVTQHTAVLLGNSSTLNKRGENPPRCNRTTPAVFSLANPSVNAQTIFSFSAVMAFHEALTSSYQQYGEPPEQLSVMQRAP